MARRDVSLRRHRLSDSVVRAGSVPKAGINVQRLANVLMAHQLRKRDRLDSARDHATRERVAHVMKRHLFDPRKTRGGLEATLTEVAVPQRCAVLRGEHRILV